jgi:hypothetical protein
VYAYQYYCTTDYYPPECIGVSYTQQQYNSREVSADSVLCDLPTDEDGNAMDVDFVVIQASGSRTVAGTDKLIGVSFASTVPANTFSFQGSVLLESSGREDNTFWMRRILSVFVNNTTKKLVLRKQETVAARLLKDQPSGGEGSTFRMNFKVFFGRFRA